MNIIGKKVICRTVQVIDAEFILKLRLDEELNKFISKTSTEIEKQIKWIGEYKGREKEGKEYYFIIIDKSNLNPMGTIRLSDINGNRFTSGSWIIEKGAPTYFSIESYQLCLSFAFNELGLSKNCFTVRKEPKQVSRFHELFGSIKLSEDDRNNYYTLSKEKFNNNTAKMLKVCGYKENYLEYRIVE